MKARLLAGVIGILSHCAIPANTAAADAPHDFAYALTIDRISSDALYRIVVPEPVYEGVAFADLRDVRIFNGNDEVVAYAFRPLQAERKQPAAVKVPFFDLRGSRGSDPADIDIVVETRNGETSLRMKSNGKTDEARVLLGYLVDLSATEETFSELVLEWQALPGGYIGSVNVEGSDDLQSWSQIVRRAPLLRLSQQGQQLDRNTISLPRGVRRKYLRLTWPEDSKIVELTAVAAQPVEEHTPLVRKTKQVAASAETGKRGDYLADLGGLFPVDRLTIRLPQDNSVAPVKVDSRSDPNEAWRRVASTVAYRLRQDGQIIENPTMSISPRPHRYWRLQVDEQSGGIGEGAIALEVAWVPHEIIFTARGPQPFRLAFGNSRVRTNALPVQTVVPNWGRDTAPVIALASTGEAETLAGATATEKRIDVRKVALWAALFAGVAFLGFMAWRIARQMNADEK